MASGLLALLDDIAAIAKVAAASIDDVSVAAGKARESGPGSDVADGNVVGSSPAKAGAGDRTTSQARIESIFFI